MDTCKEIKWKGTKMHLFSIVDVDKSGDWEKIKKKILKLDLPNTKNSGKSNNNTIMF